MPSSGQNVAARTTVDGQARDELGRFLGRQLSRIHAERPLEVPCRAEGRDLLLGAQQEEVAVLDDVEGQPVGLAEPDDHRHAGE